MTVDAAPTKSVSQSKLSPQDAFRVKWRESAGNPQSTLVNPYPGLRSFNVDEAHIFRARVNQIRALRNAFAGTTPTDGPRHVIMVVGGSSSGKSSIVKAGLLADIHSLQMPGEGGNWYVAECRPVQAPMQELLHGLTAMVVDAVFNELKGEGSVLAAKVDEALDVIDAPDIVVAADGDARVNAMQRVRALLDARLWSVRHIGEPASMAPALILFARETLNALDRHLHRFRAGPPRLLISIDQFEEIFRCADGPERDAVFGLIRFADQAEAQNAPELYVVASMRSEELHRCSEFKGVADILNRSVHLVELVLREDAKLAIVEPGRFTLQGYGFPVEQDPNRPYTKDAVEAIADAYEFSSSTIEHRADALSLLQHFLRLLWDRAVSEWVAADTGTAELRIDLAALSAIPGWDTPSRPARVLASADKAGEAQHRLASVLNYRADAIYKKAIQAWCDAAGDSSEATKALARSVLKAAFVSLARRDDQRRVVRDWKTISDMLLASAEAERFAQSGATAAKSRAKAATRFRTRFQAPLAAALREFERATLVERRPDAAAGGRPGSDKYTVYHEAFIRNWGQYADWVREAGKAGDTLRSIYEELRQIGQEPSTPDSRKPEDIITAGHEADLSAVIGSTDESVETAELAAADEQRGWASRAWAAAEIARGAKSGETIDLSGALAGIRDARRGAIIARASHLELEAKALRANVLAANLSLLVTIACTALILTFSAAFFFYSKNSENQELVRISRLEKAGLEASETAGNSARTPQKDLDLWLALTHLKKVADTKWWLWGASEEISRQREKARIQTANRARRVLADLTFMPMPSASFIGKATKDDVDCLPKLGDVKLAPPNNIEAPRAPETVTYTIKDDQLKYTINGEPEKTALRLNSPKAIVCFSRDATAILVMNEVEGQPYNYVVLPHWNKTDGKWTAFQSYNQPRYVLSRASLVLLAANPIYRERTEAIKFFRQDNILGFLVPTDKAADQAADQATGKQTSLLWTNDGYSEALSFGQEYWGDTPEPKCDARGPDSPNSRSCIVKGSSHVQGEDVEATYIVFEGEGQLQQCTPTAEFCSINIKIVKKNETKANDKLVEFTYLGRPVKYYALHSDFLWLQGDDNIVRRFDRRPDTAEKLLELRWENRCALKKDDRGGPSSNEREMGEIPDFYNEIPVSFDVDCKREANTK